MSFSSSIMNTIYYKIADFTLSINTPDILRTRTLLHTFAPFELLGSKGRSDELDTSFVGNTPIEDINEIEWRESREDQSNVISYGISRVKEGLFFRMKNSDDTINHLYVSSDGKQAVSDVDLTNLKGFNVANVLIRTAFCIYAAHHRGIKLHASVVKKDGVARLFMGRSGTGKSTHTRLWLQYVEGSTMLNDDEPMVRIDRHGEIRVYGTPWSGKTNCYINDSAPIKALVHLYQASENKLSKLSAVEGYASLLFSTSLLRSSREIFTLQSDIIGTLASSLPIYRLDCRPDEAAVRLTESI